MTTSSRSRGTALALSAVALTVGLAACSSPGAPSSEVPAATGTVQIEDNHGVQTVALPPARVIATDNRLFQTLAEWDVPLAAAPVPLIAGDSPYKTDPAITDLGSHNEPDLEAVVAVEPDLIINGQRFASFYEDLRTLAPEASIIELDPRETEPLADELKRQVQALGQVFGREEDAQRIVDDFDAAVARVQAAYDPADRVMAIITSGGEINYAAPGTGRTLGPVFDMLGLTPALQADGSTDHQGDDISVEAIAQSNPDVILAMDRDAAISANLETEYVPADQLIANSEALRNVPAVQQDRIVYMPQYTYVNEGIQTYTAFFESLADRLERT